MKIRKALIIADPWIGYILDGSKTWEMRSNAVSHRGWFGLIRKGTGAVYGVARLVNTGAPLSPDEMVATFERHRIPEDMIRSGKVAKWNTPWILSDVQRLSSPVPYRHRSGAVTWVELDADVAEKVAHHIREPFETTLDLPRAKPLPTRQSSITNPGESQLAIQKAAISDQLIADGTLIGQIEITQGNIDNNHIYLRSFFDRFPEDAVGGSNRHERAIREVSVDWGGPTSVQTDLDGSKRFFRARSWIQHFFELNNAEAGDTVLVEETGPYSYSVRLRKEGRA